MLKQRKHRFLFFLIVAGCFFNGCAHHPVIPKDVKHTAYVAQAINDSPLSRYAPVFFISGTENPCNRIGSFKARYADGGDEHVYIDTEKPAVYYMEKEFSTDRGHYKNLIYRIHFSRVPFSLFPFNLTAGKNVGVMVVITLDDQARPVLITTVHTCGCYKAFAATSYLPTEAMPGDWNKEKAAVYGETLPGLLDYENKKKPKLLVYLRPDVHRVMDLQVIDEPDIRAMHADMVDTPLMDASILEHISVNGNTTSVYYESGLLNGYVKGSIKPWESLLLSVISLDLFVGTDKVYADSEKTGNPFYTSLKPWNRKKSDMWNFAEFLNFWGWRL